MSSVGRLEVEPQRPGEVERRHGRRRPLRDRSAPTRSARACRDGRRARAARRRGSAPCRGRSTADARRPRCRRRRSPNRWWASITSRPLFISVAESIVIFAPMLQVGCASASATVTSASASRRAAAERPARGGDDEAGDGALGGARQALGERRVLAVDRQHPPAARRAARPSRARRPRPGSPCSRAPGRRPRRTSPAWRAGRRRRRSRSGRRRRRTRRPAARRRRRPRAPRRRTRGGRRAAAAGSTSAIRRTPWRRAAATRPAWSEWAASAHAVELGVRAHDLERLRADRAGRAQDGHGSHRLSVGGDA